jgi:AraC-like DNA-binding protein
MDVRYERGYLRQLLGDSDLRRNLRMATSPEGPLQTVTKITPAMNHVLHLMEDHALRGRASFLFVMAKVLELMWLFLTSLDTAERHPSNPSDREAVQNAQKILETNLCAAPCLVELSARVGMSVSKLKQLFPRVCGLTPYAYLRQARMERAMYLLYQGGMNVTEASLEVGYASPSRFSRAFAAHFGFKPSLVKHFPEYCFHETRNSPSNTASRDEAGTQCRLIVAEE